MDDWTVCRLCLETTAESMKGFMEMSYKSIPFGNMFFELVGTTFTDYPSFPGKICLCCEKEMIQAYKFRAKCMEVEEKLKDLFSDGSQVVSMEFVPISNSSKSTEKPTEDVKSEQEEATSDAPLDIPMTDETGRDTPTPGKSIYNMSREEIKEMESTTVECSKCKKTFRGIKMFKKHSCSLQREKNGEEEISEESMDENEDNTNRGKIRNKKIYKCKICNKVLCDRNVLSLHMDGHNNVRRYVCVYCDKKFRCWTSRRTHIFKEHFKKDYCHCPHCGKGFNTYYNLKIHISAYHAKEDADKAFFGQCDKCGKTCNNPQTLGRHIQTHVGKQKCEICGKWLKNKRSLRVHKKGHTDKMRFTCPVCSKGYAFHYLMKTHVRSSHPNDVHLLPPPTGQDSTIASEATQSSQLSNKDTD